MNWFIAVFVVYVVSKETKDGPEQTAHKDTINNTTVITWSRDVTAPRGAVIESFAVE